MTRIYIFVIAALSALTTSGAESTHWPPVGFVEVRAYLYNLEGDQATPILKQGTLHASVWNPKGAELNKPQIATVQKAVADHHPEALELGQVVIGHVMRLFTTM